MAFLGRIFILVCVTVAAVTSKSMLGNKPRQAGSSPGVFRFKFKTTESGTTFTEKVEIDTEDRTETFHIPQHNQVDEASIKHLFDLNVTVYRLPLKDVCYVTALKSQQPRPMKLARDLTMQNGKQGTEVYITHSTYIIRGEAPNDQPWNSPKIQEFCRGLDLLYAEPSEDSDNWMITKDDDDATPGRTRKRRQSNSPRGQCPPNPDFRADCPMDKIERRCLFRGNVCTYLRTCGLIEKNNKIETACATRHVYDDLVCCTNYCRG